MRRHGPIMAAALLLAGPAPGCMRSQAPAAVPVAAEGTLVYACSDGYRFSVRVRGDSAALTLPGRDVLLPQVVTASGAKYQATDVVFWSRGAVADLADGVSTHRDCRASAASDPWDEARLRGIEFRAIGQEPGWVLELDAGHALRFAGDYGASRLFAPLPEAVFDEPGVARYVVADGDSMFVVTVRPAGCQDVMSGEAFTHQASVRTRTGELRGCGRLLETGDLAGRYWKLVELEGAAVVALHEPHLRLLARDERFAGGTGCNRMTGGYTLAGDRLRIVTPATTRVACTDRTAAALEQTFLQALERVDAFTVQRDRLILYAGTAPVARFAAVPLR